MALLRALSVAALALLATGVAGAAARAQSPAAPGWFHLDTTLAPGWEAVEIDANAIMLRPRDLAESGPRRHILALQARASSAYDVAVSEIARVFDQKRMAADILVARYDDDGKRARSIIAQAEHDGVELILATGSEAMVWLWSNYQGGRLPVVSVCAKDPVAMGLIKTYNAGTGTNFALTSLNLPANVQMAYALELMPRLRNLAIIVDSQNRSAVETQATPIAAEARARGVRVLDLAVEHPARAAEELDRLVTDAVASMRLNDVNLDASMFLVTGSTAVFEQMGTINARASRVPVVSMVPETVHAGPNSAVLSVGVSFRSNAHLAAVYAGSILEGRDHPGELRVGVLTPPDIEINFRRAREIGLKIPFSFFESADVVYDYDDKAVRTIEASEK